MGTILYITGFKVWKLTGYACHFQIVSNNEMPLYCAGESMKINLSLSLIWSRETKLHFLDHRPCCGYFVWIHGRVTLEWIDQSCVWWTEALPFSLFLLLALMVNENHWDKSSTNTGFPCHHVQQQGVTSCTSTLHISTTQTHKWQHRCPCNSRTGNNSCFCIRTVKCLTEIARTMVHCDSAEINFEEKRPLMYQQEMQMAQDTCGQKHTALYSPTMSNYI